MLKSFEYIRNIEVILDELVNLNRIVKYNIKLSVNQQLDIYISSNEIFHTKQLEAISIELLPSYDRVDFNLDSVYFNFFTTDDAEENDCYFAQKKIDYGMRRSLDNLIDHTLEKKNNNSNIITFYSHKGGVGRTTSLALLASYYSEQGKKVFIIDCDFEAPGLLNFFSISQFTTPKNGVVEYLNDINFDSKTSLNDDYVYQVSNRYTGEGSIHMMPAGNVFSLSKQHYLEGLSRLDIFGPSMFLKDMNNLILDIQKNYSPDVILIDSRTGFNNVFGVLSKISDHVVALFGDDSQNNPGMEFILDKYSDSSVHSKLTIVLSIVSTNIRKRHSNLVDKVSHYMQEYDSEAIIPTFVFPREAALEMIGTPDESEEDFKYYSSKNNPTSYTPFFSHMENILDGLLNNAIIKPTTSTLHDIIESQEINDCESIQIESNGVEIDLNVDSEEDEDNSDNIHDVIPEIINSTYADKIVNDLLEDFPQLYAENVTFEDSYLKEKFYIRKCMQDIFLPEYRLLIGGKGTGKTYFYKALQNQKFVSALLSRAEKTSKNHQIVNIISDVSSPRGYLELTAYLSGDINNEEFVRKFWIIYIWAELSAQKIFESESTCNFEIKNNAMTAKAIKDIINDEDRYLTVELELAELDKHLKSRDIKLIVTFDQLDAAVKPKYWDKGISPLIRICQSNSWERIQPKLFLRRDLFEKLGNITNKQSLASQAIDLEWSCDEMYAFFLKIIYSKSEKSFHEFLFDNFSETFSKDTIIKKLKKKNSYNQLPDDVHILKPLVNSFFGKPNLDYVDAYEALYRNIRNANQTISLRPFLDMIKFAIEEQIKDSSKKRKQAVIGIDYCFLRSVRAKAVKRYFQDMAQEEGNDVIKFFIEDILQHDVVPPHLKCSSLIQRDFEKLVDIVRGNHKEIEDVSTTTFEEMLVLNGIIFVTLIPGGIKKFSFAYLYKFYLNLNSPSSRKRQDRI